MDLFLAPALEDRYTGAFTLRFNSAGGETGAGGTALCFMYTLDNQGFRLEFVPASNVEDITVSRRAGSPVVLYFFRDERS
jgi:hypothetical protein